MAAPRLGQRRDETSRHRLAIEALTRVTRAANRSLDPAEVLPAAVDAVASAVGVDGVLVRTLDAATGRLTLAAHVGVSEEFVKALRTLEYGQGLAGQVVVADEPLVVDDARDDPRLPWAEARAEGMHAVAIVPIHARDSVLGTMATFTRSVRSFRADDVELLQTIADQVGLALENARLYAAELTRVAALEELSRLKSDFASTVSHELRTPMTLIRTAFDQVLRQWQSLPEERRLEYLHLGKRGADRLQRLLENLLVASRIEDDRVTLRLADVDLRDVVREVIEDVRLRHDRQIVEAPPVELPRVRAHRDQLCEVLINLLENALRYSAAPNPVRLAVEREDEHAVVSVADHGIGIAAEDMPRLFQRFERIDRTVRAEAGTGLGLYISRRLVEAMGGQIWAESKLGVGSTFRVRVPLTS